MSQYHKQNYPFDQFILSLYSCLLHNRAVLLLCLSDWLNITVLYSLFSFSWCIIIKEKSDGRRPADRRDFMYCNNKWNLWIEDVAIALSACLVAEIWGQWTMWRILWIFCVCVCVYVRVLAKRSILWQELNESTGEERRQMEFTCTFQTIWLYNLRLKLN